MFEFFENPGSAVEAGTFIPISDLASLISSELAAGESANLKFGKTLNALCIAMTNFADISTVLGFTPSLGSIAGAGGNDFTRTLTFTWQKYKNHQTDLITTIPVPSVGALSGVGGLTIDSVFPNAVKVAAAGSISGAGVLVQSSALSALTNLAHADIDVTTDSRLWFIGLAEAMSLNAVVRAAAISSPVLSTSRPAVSSATIPATFTQAEDPTTGIAAASLGYSGLDQRTLSLTLTYQVSPTGESFDVLSATT